MSTLKRMSKVALAATALLAVVTAAPGAPGTGVTDEIRVTVGKSAVIDYPEDISRISTSDPTIVDYVPVSTREVLLHAKGMGSATLVVWAKSGQRNFYTINVEMNLEPIRKLIHDTFPSEDIHIGAARDAVALTGHVSTQQVADRATALVTPLAKAVVNNLKVKASPVEKQILLRVKFAELNRSHSSQFGVNLLSTGALNTLGSVGTGQYTSTKMTSLNGGSSDVTLSDALNIFAFRPDLNLAAAVKLLQAQNLLQILAEPNLVTTNGKEASFLVGGEFPVPVVQGGSNVGAVTIQFREYGIRLTFNPLLTENNTLKMHVKPEVSTIDLANAVSISGFTVPALATRRVESDIELQPGQSFVIGGLIDDRTTETFNKIPGLANIPLLGTIFKSRSESKQKTELIVMVTPEVIEPAAAGDPKLMPHLPGGFIDPGMLPNGMPQSSNVGSGSKAIPGGKNRETLFPKSGRSK